jgi:hypothetical protein
MELENKKVPEGEEKEWENPIDPANTTDERDKEQLLRQYKEAKRRKDNLTEEGKDKDTEQTKKL